MNDEDVIATTLEERIMDIEQRVILMRRRADILEEMSREIITLLKEMRDAGGGDDS